jgi:Pyridoxamine 5'-phosphate oxidase
MSLAMSRTEREAFLADVHVGVLSVDQPGHGPLSVPVWYSYAPGGTVDVITGGESRKAHCIVAAGRFSLCVQTEVAPYKYVSVEGAIGATEKGVPPDVRRDMAYRYLGPEFGDLYLQATADDAAGTVLFHMTPESWLTTDFSKQFG